MLLFGPQTSLADHPLAYEQLVSPTAIRVAVAFCTEAGARTLAKILPITESDGPPTFWMVGIQNGLTQPEGLRFLCDLPNSQVRVPYGRKSLETPGVRAPIFFHAKIYSVESADEISIVSASGNLTDGGLLDNAEQFMVWRGERESVEAQALDRWWASWWKRSDIVDEPFIRDYDEVRQPPAPPPGGGSRPAPVIEAEPAPADLKSARAMWIEATRRLEGGSENQLELMLSAHHFFYPEHEPPRDVGRSLTFEDAEGTLYENPKRIIHFNGPPMMAKGNAMWRIRLPTENEGMTGYQQGSVVFRFERGEAPDRYRVEFTEIGSPTAARWAAESRKVSELPGPPPRRMGWH